jgi:hypothetical protein
MKAAILQPAYLPWIGFFGLIDLVSIFVIYDDVQFTKQSWQQRNRIKTASGWIWLTVPVFQKFGQLITQVLINNDLKWAEKHWKSISYNYSRSAHFKDHSSILKDLYEQRWDRLLDLNIALITLICDFLDIRAEFVTSSELKAPGEKTDRLVSMLDQLGADEYISGPRAKSYLELEKFKESGITVCWYEFTHPMYSQLFGKFIPYLSTIDLMFNAGKASRNLIRKSNETALRQAY